MIAEPLLVFGGAGYLGRALVRVLQDRGTDPVCPRHADASVEDARAVAAVIAATTPGTIVNLAAARPQASREALAATNTEGARNVASAAAAAGVHLLHVSTDCVLDGLDPPYGNDAPANPTNAYGRSKAGGEAAVREALPSATIVRTSLIWDPNRIDRATQGFADRLARGEPLRLFDDEIRCPLDRPTLAEAIVRLLEQRHAGVVNVAGREALSRHAFGTLLMEHFDVPGRERTEIAHLAELDQPPNERRAPDLTLDVREAEKLLAMRFAGPCEVLSD